MAITYSLTDSSGKFSLVGNELRVAGALDYEIAASYGISVRATDDSGWSKDFPLTVNVLDVEPEAVLPGLPLNSKIGFVGDSITSEWGMKSWHEWLMFYTFGRFFVPADGNRAVYGTNSAAAKTQALSLLAAYPTLPVIFVHTGTNDSTASVVISNITDINTAALAQGTKVVIITLLPLPGLNATYRSDVRTGLLALAGANTKVLDADSIGFVAATDTADNVHPNPKGAAKFGSAVASLISAWTPTTEILRTSADASNLAINPMMLGTAGTDSTWGTPGDPVADSWTAIQDNGPQVTASKGTLANGQPCQVFDIADVSGNISYLRQDITINGAIGDQFEVWANVELSGVANPQGVALQLCSPTDNNAFYTRAFTAVADNTADTWPLPSNGVMRGRPVTLTAAVTTARLQIYWVGGAVTGAFRMKIGQVMCRKVV